MTPIVHNKTEVIIGEGVTFDHYNRITGYLTGTTDKWNNAKQAELKDRTKHTSFDNHQYNFSGN